MPDPVDSVNSALLLSTPGTVRRGGTSQAAEPGCSVPWVADRGGPVCRAWAVHKAVLGGTIRDFLGFVFLVSDRPSLGGLSTEL